MFRRIEDFRQGWAYETEATLKMFRALKEESLDRAVAPGSRTLGRIAWHIVLMLGETMGQTGLGIPGPTGDDPRPPLADMIHIYEDGAERLVEAVSARWTDETLGETVPMYGERWPRGTVLTSLIAHQTHHRGQMTVLMRQAGLKVPGVYGPAREEWAALNLPPQA